MKYILCLDGGGIKGVFSARILQKIDEFLNQYLNTDIKNKFHLIAGTSTGSIIAGCLACEISAADIYNYYIELSKKIFRKSDHKGVFKSIYKTKRLEQALKDKINVRLNTEEKEYGHLLIPITNLSLCNMYLYKSYKSETSSIFVKDAILASCSAPIYFDPMKWKEVNKLFCDGGLWANNPSFISLIATLCDFGNLQINDQMYDKIKDQMNDIKILSIGTGFTRLNYPYDQKKWGLFTYKADIIDLIFMLQSKMIHDTLLKLLKKTHYLRINFETDSQIKLNDFTKIEFLTNRADNEFVEHGMIDQLKIFFDTRSQEEA